MAVMPRVQAVLLPILRAALPDIAITSWIPDIDQRNYPLLNVRRLGGQRDQANAMLLSKPVVEMTAFTADGIVETEELYETALEALYDACYRQVTTPAGYIVSVDETFGATQFSSPFMDTWRIQGLLQIGLRPPRT